MTTIPALTRPPVVQVKIIETVADAEVCVWSGDTRRMRPLRIYVTYEAVMGAPSWWLSITLEGPSIRKDGTEGMVTARQHFYREEDGDSFQFAPEWVREFVRLNEPPEYLRGV